MIQPVDVRTKQQLVYRMLLDRTPGEVDLEPDDLRWLLRQVSTERFVDARQAFLYVMDDTIRLAFSESPDTIIYVHVPPGGRRRQELMAALEGAGVALQGLGSQLPTDASLFWGDLHGKGLRFWRRLRTIAFLWLPVILSIFVSTPLLTTVGQSLVAGIGLFLAVFVVLGFDRLVQGETVIPIRILHGMYSVDRYIVRLCAYSLSSAIIGTMLTSLLSPDGKSTVAHVPTEWVCAAAHTLIAFSILALMICLVALSQHYLLRLWTKIEGESCAKEYNKWRSNRPHQK